jgi:hypothetical protein
MLLLVHAEPDTRSHSSDFLVDLGPRQECDVRMKLRRANPSNHCRERNQPFIAQELCREDDRQIPTSGRLGDGYRAEIAMVATSTPCARADELPHNQQQFLQADILVRALAPSASRFGR